MQAVLIAIGNSLRRDDGVAHRVLALVGPVAGVLTHDVMQLMPEHALEFAPAEKVFFIDADTTVGKPHVETLPASVRSQSLAHSLLPEAVVALSRKLYGFHGQAYLCRVPGADFSDGETLTQTAEENAAGAAKILRRMLGC
jgi:Ni,Fe-hydrogenase maturation factor